MFGSVGLTLNVICLLSWHRREKSFRLRVMPTNHPAPSTSSTVMGPPVASVGATTAGAFVAAACVGSTTTVTTTGATVGGTGVGGTSVAAWVASTTTVCTTTTGV